MSSAAQFHRRANFEAHRYGGDAWIFVRELLQNSRDAGASRIDLEVQRCDGVDRIVCRDDGRGMTFGHAKRYLFTLYASSKTGETDTAGRFGIGFWSVLRFNPRSIVIRSAPEGGAPWELRLSGDLSKIESGTSSVVRGTEIELVRPNDGDDPAEATWQAVRRDARHLRRQGDGDEILDVRVNGRRATEEINLAAPSLEFVRGDLRGAVALASRSEVDLLAHGLRVRTTATLDELLIQPRRHRRQPPGPDHLLPKVILDSRRLQVLMARGDARTDRELRRLVSLGRRAIRRLVRGQLDRTAGLGFMGRAAMRVGEVAASVRALRLGAGLVAATAVAAAVWWAAAEREILGSRASNALAIAVPNRAGSPGSILDVRAPERYRGPSVSPLGSQTATLELEYRPSDAEPMLTVFRVAGLDDAGRPVEPRGTEIRKPYSGVNCRERCIEIALELDGLTRLVTLPVPTGHLLDPASIRVTGGSAVLEQGRGGLPRLRLDGDGSRRVEYRTGEGVEMDAVQPGRWPKLPDDADDFAGRLEPLRTTEAVRAATAWVRQRLAWDTSADTVARHREAARAGKGWIDRCLMIGAGDCDVLNAVLASILERAGIPVRMAVGFVGSAGRPRPGLHAWVEYRTSDGVWRWADASTGATRPMDAAETASGEPRSVGGVRSTSATDSNLTPPSTANTWLKPAGAGLILTLLGVIGFTVIRSRIPTSEVRLADETDMAGLLRGALARPESYREVPALFRRRVVPLIADRSLSLEGARSLARRGRLAAGTVSSTLARLAGDRRRVVIDTSRPEGRAVAEVLGAVDLDRWEAMIERGVSHPLLRRLEDEAKTVGLCWEFVLSPDSGGAVHVLDGTLVGRRRGNACVAMDPMGELWRRVVRLERRSPAAAVLMLADRVIESMPENGERSRRLLARLAAATVVETAEGGA